MYVTSHFEQHKGMVLGLFGCFTLVLKDTNKFDYSQFAILSLAIYPFSQGSTDRNFLSPVWTLIMNDSCQVDYPRM